MFTKGHKINVGRVYSQERNNKVRTAKLGMIRGPLSEGWREKIRLSVIRRHKDGELFGFQKGKDNIKWNGGISPEIQRIRACKEYQRWTKEAKKKSLVCCECGSDRNLEADHYPKTFNQIITENNISTLEQARSCNALWEAESRILCRMCHRKF